MGLASSFYAFMVLFHLVLLLLLLLHLAEAAAEDEPSCPPSFHCGKHGLISFPFANKKYSRCGLVTVNCDDERQPPSIKLGGKQYDIVVNQWWKEGTILLFGPVLPDKIYYQNCDYLLNLNLPNFSSSLRFHNLSSFFKCPQHQHPKNEQQRDAYFSAYQNSTKCPGYILYYKNPYTPASIPNPLPDNCSAIQLPIQPSHRHNEDIFNQLGAEFSLEVNVSDACNVCQKRGGRCPPENENNLQWCVRKEGKHLGLILGTAIPGAVLLLVCLLICITWRSKKWCSLHFFSRINSSGPSSKEDIEGGIVFFGVPVFPYGELEEATKNFHPSKELGDGGFGIVYHGKLRDGREVAVKRLYEKNYKQVQQFINEIEILTCLRHRNLVTLYGCTSRHSRELLLVYEYIPNGTVADHIHGDRAKPGSPLTWPIRMNIALETASALTYLHASEIIHRDVKTNNILLDNNFCVKVADFGLSRLYPNDVSHISTAPQGTPGYVDPDYHKCYQLTNKSDVYSFGVVLIELISSMPAVDMKRHWDEINLADLAINRIQNCALDELVDPSLGFESDAMVNKMITAVAELAFQCLQHEKEFRPTMNEVLEALKEIKGEECQEEKTGDVGALKTTQPPPAPKSDGVLLLKYIEQHPSQGLVGLTHPTPVALAEPPFHSV